MTISLCTFDRNIAGVMALYRKPLDFIVMPAARHHLLSVVVPLMKKSGGTIVITGVSPGTGMEGTLMSMLPGGWKGSVIARDNADGTLTIGSVTACRRLFLDRKFQDFFHDSTVSTLNSIERAVGRVWNTADQNSRPSNRKLLLLDA